jgi:hypothetical protein
MASSTFDAAHIFVRTRRPILATAYPGPTTDTVFEVAVNGKIYRVVGRDLQRWILKEREERKGPRGILFSRRPTLDDFDAR